MPFNAPFEGVSSLQPREKKNARTRHNPLQWPLPQPAQPRGLRRRPAAPSQDQARKPSMLSPYLLQAQLGIRSAGPGAAANSQGRTLPSAIWL